MGIPAPRRAVGIALALGLGLAPLAAGGQSYPDRSIRLIVVTAAGGMRTRPIRATCGA